MYVFCADFVWVSYWYKYGFRADFVWIPYRCMCEFRADFVWKSYSNLVWKVVAKSHTFPINFPHLQLVHFPYESRTPLFTGVLPFEASVLRDRLYVTEMLLVSGCSYGMFSLDNNLEIKDNRESDLKDLMKKWNVDENNVKPLQQQCRRMILNHLSPQADKKIMKMPLPPIIINYLSIPELDDILTACRNSTRMNRYKVFY